MYKWIKNLVDAYDKMFVIETPKKPIIYKSRQQEDISGAGE